MELFSLKMSGLGYNTCQWVEDASLIIDREIVSSTNAPDS
jgi:hypothetical protein